jgi:hypothetical protein
VLNKTLLSCQLDYGGLINPIGFIDKDGSCYIIFKVDSNSIRHSRDCNNSITPLVPTLILLQKVEDDGFILIRDAVLILDCSNSSRPLVKAPNLILHSDIYFLFYSTHCFTDTEYNMHWVTLRLITDPYIKSGWKLFKTSNYALTSPSGGTVYKYSDKMLFHGFYKPNKQCTYTANIAINSNEVTVL